RQATGQDRRDARREREGRCANAEPVLTNAMLVERVSWSTGRCQCCANANALHGNSPLPVARNLTRRYTVIVEPTHSGFRIGFDATVFSRDIDLPPMGVEDAPGRPAGCRVPRRAGARFCTDLLVARRQRQSRAVEP